jgi:hypothetical protein
MYRYSTFAKNYNIMGFLDKGMFANNTKNNLIGTAAGGASSLTSAITGLDSPVGDAIDKAGDALMSVNPMIGGIVKGVGMLTNIGFGSKINQENVNKIENNIAQMNGFQSSASDTSSLLAEAGSIPSAMSFNSSFVGKDGLFSNKAKNKYNELKAGVAEASDRSSRNLMANASNISTDRAMGLQRQQIFDFGGQLSTNGTLFDSPMYEINAGGTHETNPNGGVPIKIDPMTGEPQLAEEGEAVYDQFVFSNNPNLPLFDDTKKGLNLSRKVKTYADAAKEINADVSEMPNDMLARKTAAIRLSALAQTQEQIKQALEAEGYNQEEQLMM